MASETVIVPQSGRGAESKARIPGPLGGHDQVVAKLRAYMDLGIDAFILSGYPHLAECDPVARGALPDLR